MKASGRGTFPAPSLSRASTDRAPDEETIESFVFQLKFCRETGTVLTSQEPFYSYKGR